MINLQEDTQPPYMIFLYLGEGDTRDEALDNLINAVIDMVDLWRVDTEKYKNI